MRWGKAAEHKTFAVEGVEIRPEILRIP